MLCYIQMARTASMGVASRTYQADTVAVGQHTPGQGEYLEGVGRMEMAPA